MMGRNKPKAAVGAITLQYANGKSLVKLAGEKRFGNPIGFYVETGKDEQLDAAMGAAGVKVAEIKHMSQGGSNIVRHWWLGETVVFR